MSLLSFIGKIFSRDTFMKALPVLMIILGLIIFGASYLLYPVATHPILHDATKSLGQAILVSGVISVLLNSMKYIGIFQQAVYDVVYTVDYLKTKNDLPQVFNRVVTALCHEKFPTLREHLQTQLLEKFLPTKNNFFYTRQGRETFLSWADRQRMIVQVSDNVEIVLQPSSKNEIVDHYFISLTDSRTPWEIGKIELISLDVDGVDHSSAMKEGEYHDEFGGKGVMCTYSIPLSGRSEYRITRSIKRKISLLDDPVIAFEALQFSLNTTVKVRCENPDLNVVFVGAGVEFEDRASRGGEWKVHKELNGSMLPTQGYMLFVQLAAPALSSDAVSTKTNDRISAAPAAT